MENNPNVFEDFYFILQQTNVWIVLHPYMVFIDMRHALLKAWFNSN
jgi:hypothetical protein